MEKKYFTSYLCNDRIEINTGLFSIATIINSEFYLKIQLDGPPDRYFNFYDLNTIICYLSYNIFKKRNKIKTPDLKHKNEKIQIDNLHSNWLSLLEKVDKEVLAVHKMNLHSTGFKKYYNFSDTPEVKLIYLPEFYNFNYLVQDAKKYRAANIAFNNIDYLIARKMPSFIDYETINQFYNAQLLKNLSSKRNNLNNDELYINCEKNHVQINIAIKDNDSFSDDLNKYCSIDNILKESQNWMCLFSDNGKTYRSLNKTLMNLPPQIPEGIVCQLPTIHLHKPLTERLIFLLHFLSNEPFHQKIYRNASSDQIRTAFRIYCIHFNYKVSYSTSKIYDFLMFLDDYRAEYNGNIIDLTKRAIKWHHDNIRRNYDDFIDFNLFENLDKKTAIPPIPLPKNQNIKFLSSVREILEEGQLMNHCVATYINQALSGQSYLFHIDYKGEKATAEVNRFGNIRQIKGVENKHNNACDYGMIALKEWSNKLIYQSKHLGNFPIVDIDYPF